MIDRGDFAYELQVLSETLAHASRAISEEQALSEKDFKMLAKMTHVVYNKINHLLKYGDQ